MKFSNYKNQRGQVLLMVLITSTIALIIVTGVFLRVLRLTRASAERETHEEAFASADLALRIIFDQIENGVYPDEVSLPGLLAGVTGLVSATVVDKMSLENKSISVGEVYELIGDGSTGSVNFGIKNWNNEVFLFKVTYYNPSTGKYSVRERLFKGCAMTSSDGDIPWGGTLGGNVGCELNNPSSNTDTLKYNTTGNEISIKIRPIVGTLVFDISSTSNSVLAKEYRITTKEGETMSETVLTVDANKTMPTIFDHVLYNGIGKISK